MLACISSFGMVKDWQFYFSLWLLFAWRGVGKNRLSKKVIPDPDKGERSNNSNERFDPVDKLKGNKNILIGGRGECRGRESMCLFVEL